MPRGGGRRPLPCRPHKLNPPLSQRGARDAQHRIAIHVRCPRRRPDPRRQTLAGRVCQRRAGRHRARQPPAERLQPRHGQSRPPQRHGGRAIGAPRRHAGPAARRAGQYQGPGGGRRRAVSSGLGDLRRGDRRTGRHRGDPAARCRRDHHRQDHHAGIRRQGADRRAKLRHHSQPVEPRTHPRRLLRRWRRSRRRRARPAGARHRRRRLDPRPRRRLWPGRAETDPRRGTARGPGRRAGQHQLCRADHPHRDRRRADARGAGRRRPSGAAEPRPLGDQPGATGAIDAAADRRRGDRPARRLYRPLRQSARRRRRHRQHPRHAGHPGRSRGRDRGGDRSLRLGRAGRARAVPGRYRRRHGEIPAAMAEPDGPGDAGFCRAWPSLHPGRVAPRRMGPHRPVPRRPGPVRTLRHAGDADHVTHRTARRPRRRQ